MKPEAVLSACNYRSIGIIDNKWALYHVLTRMMNTEVKNGREFEVQARFRYYRMGELVSRWETQ